MRTTDFVNRETGQIVRSIGGNDTFVPAPSPPRIDYDGALVLALSRADTALSELSGLGRQ
ncbi:MAG: Fic family protein, partial [Chloroflexia bacterium]|nr:Fic family protein [Chloroflexia bacterium]